MAELADFLLIHGACHGAWCWRDVLPLLNRGPHRARGVDLPAAGGDPTPIADVTLASYRDAVVAALDGPTILVGHSLGGIAITAAAAAAPDCIARLVYLAAWAPSEGESARDLRSRYACDALIAAMRFTEDGRATTYDAAALEPVFYPDCPPGTADFARPRLTPQPTKPSTEPAPALPAEINRHCIRCTEDRAIPYAAQQDMTAAWPAGAVHDLPSGHSPFFAMPDRLAAMLLQIAEAP